MVKIVVSYNAKENLVARIQLAAIVIGHVNFLKDKIKEKRPGMTHRIHFIERIK